MYTVIKNKVYNTDTAKLIGRYITPEHPDIFQTLYRKKTGEYFLHKQNKDHPEAIIPLDFEHAKIWAEMSLCAADYNRAFLGTTQNKAMKITLTDEARSLLNAAQSLSGKTYNEIISELIVRHLMQQKNNNPAC